MLGVGDGDGVLVGDDVLVGVFVGVDVEVAVGVGDGNSIRIPDKSSCCNKE